MIGVPAEPGSLLYLAYIVGFGAAATACFVSVGRARLIEDPDTRRGLVWLLLTSGSWAVFQTAYLVLPSPQLREVAYVFGLIVGLATVGPWLYFCSAYTGRSLHRSPTIQRGAVVLFLAVSLVKLTNPVHGLYFTATVATEPFPHLAIQNGVLHWVVLGLAYALSTVGYFMLLELFWQVGHDARPFGVLVTLTALPVLPDLVGVLRPQLPEITYEPIGVALFAVGLLFLYLDDFQVIQFTEGRDDPVIMLDDDNRVREYNAPAKELFPDLETDVPIDDIVPDVTSRVSGTADGVLQVERAGGLRYYQLTSNPFTTDRSRLGRAVTLTDITDRERHRSELERQNDRLEKFAQTVSHDLRNPLNVAMGRLNIVRERTDNEHLESVASAHTRMERLINDLLSLARQGQPITETESVHLSAVARDCWEVVATADAELVVEGDLSFEADPDRTEQLIENLFRNAVEHGSTSNLTQSDDAIDHGGDCVIQVGPLDGGHGFYVADDGPGIPEAERDQVFEYGYSTATDGTGFGLAIVAEIADAHGWDVGVVPSEAGGARFEITVR